MGSNTNCKIKIMTESSVFSVSELRISVNVPRASLIPSFRPSLQCLHVLVNSGNEHHCLCYWLPVVGLVDAEKDPLVSFDEGDVPLPLVIDRPIARYIAGASLGGSCSTIFLIQALSIWS
jgi:hypothetical protein